MNKRKLASALVGPLLFGLCMAGLEPHIGFAPAVTMGTFLWMAIWWILRPVEIYITALLPVLVNALFPVVNMTGLLAQYASETVGLVFAANLVCLTWTYSGLDRRIALRVLCIVGTSLRQQICVWMLFSALLSAFLPNAVVAAIMIPIAVSMLQFAGEGELGSSKVATCILLAVSWGISIGAAATPLGGAMNLVALSCMETYLDSSVSYVTWISQMAPFTMVLLVVALMCLLLNPHTNRKIRITKEYFTETYRELGKWRTEEILSLSLFLGAAFLSICNAWVTDVFPGMKPAYCFLLFGILPFFLTDEKKNPLMTWAYAKSEIMWGMLLLFGGSLALGKLVTESGTAELLGTWITGNGVHNEFMIVAVLAFSACLLAEVTNSTTAAAIVVPVAISLARNINEDPMPFIYIVAMAFNSSYILPVSFRAIPVSYGMNPKELSRYGMVAAITCYTAIVVFGYCFRIL